MAAIVPSGVNRRNCGSDHVFPAVVGNSESATSARRTGLLRPAPANLPLRKPMKRGPAARRLFSATVQPSNWHDDQTAV